MKTNDSFAGIGFERLGPDIDDATAQLRAEQISHFMEREVYVPVYEATLGLRYIDTDPRPGTPEDIPWRIDSMRQNHTDGSDGSYREYILAIDLDENGRYSAARHAIAGLLVATKPNGRCTETLHTPTHIAEIDVARRMYGRGLAARLLTLLRETHPGDPRIDMDVYTENMRSRKFHEKLGFVVDEAAEPIIGSVFEGTWITMATTGAEFSRRLAAHTA